jgi:carboxylate-amine ligase
MDKKTGLIFKGSPVPTVGIEVEFQLVSAGDMALTDGSDILLKAVGDKVALKHELMQSNLEINTAVCDSIVEAEQDLYNSFSTVLDAARASEILLCCGGTHPFSLWRDQSITNDPRYLSLIEELGMVGRRFNIFGLHVHVGVSDGGKCIYIMNRLLSYLPHLLALSANSPFWEGENTGLMSYRSKVFDTLPVAGLPFYFHDWDDYKRIVDCYIATGTIKTIRELWWDVRPHPDFGTIELRICDVPMTIKDSLAIAALVQALVVRLGREYEEAVFFKTPHPFIARENKWRAAKYGLDGKFIVGDGESTVHVKDALETLIRSLEGEIKELGSGRFIANLQEVFDGGSGATAQLAEFWRSRDLRNVVSFISDELVSDVASFKKDSSKV